MVVRESVWRELATTSAAVRRRGRAYRDQAYFAGVRSFVEWTIAVVAPIALVALVLSTLANIVQTGPVFSGEPVKPKLERINPMAGFKRLYNKRMLFEAVKSVLKLVLFAATVGFFFVELWPHLGELATPDVTPHIVVRGVGSRAAARSRAHSTLIGLPISSIRAGTLAEMRMSRREPGRRGQAARRRSADHAKIRER